MPRLRYQLREARSQLRHQRRRMPLMRQGEGRKTLVDVRRAWRTRGVRSGSDARRMSRRHVPHSGPLRPELSPRSRSKPELLLVVRKCQGVGPRYSWLQPGCSSEARVSEPERLHGLVDLRLDRRTQTFLNEGPHANSLLRGHSLGLPEQRVRNFDADPHQSTITSGVTGE